MTIDSAWLKTLVGMKDLATLDTLDVDGVKIELGAAPFGRRWA